MANAMKKLKLLHHLTAASATSFPQQSAAAPQPSQQQFPTPPASPVCPQTSPIRHQYHQPHANYNDVLRSARAVLNTLHASQASYVNSALVPLVSTNSLRHHHQQQQQCLLPGGFMVLAPMSTHDVPGLCVPTTPPQNMSMNNDPPPLMVESKSAPRTNPAIYSSRPPSSPRRSPSSPRTRPKLTREAVSKVGKDSRHHRWERVLRYVREQQSNALPDAIALSISAKSSLSTGTDKNLANGGVSSTSPTISSKFPDRKRRAEEIANIEACNKFLDSVDIAEQDQRSLWSGGSGGTNGVDEFVWSEDEYDDILPTPQAPPPLKKITLNEIRSGGSNPSHARDDECIFECEMQVEEADDRAKLVLSPCAPATPLRLPAVPTAPPTRTSTPLNPNSRGAMSDVRKRSFSRNSLDDQNHLYNYHYHQNPQSNAYMPVLCRETEMGRLVGRRMSTAY